MIFNSQNLISKGVMVRILDWTNLIDKYILSMNILQVSNISQLLWKLWLTNQPEYMTLVSRAKVNIFSVYNLYWNETFFLLPADQLDTSQFHENLSIARKIKKKKKAKSSKNKSYTKNESINQ